MSGNSDLFGIFEFLLAETKKKSANVIRALTDFLFISQTGRKMSIAPTSLENDFLLHHYFLTV